MPPKPDNDHFESEYAGSSSNWINWPEGKPIIRSNEGVMSTGSTFSLDQAVEASLERMANQVNQALRSGQFLKVLQVKGSDAGVGGYFATAPQKKMESEEMTREEIDAKLQLSEARLDAKVAQIDGKIDRLTDLLGSLRADIERQSASLSEKVSDVKTEMGTLKGDSRFTRWTIVITAVTSVIAVVGLVLTVQSSLLTAFSTGITAKPATSSSQSPPMSDGK